MIDMQSLEIAIETINSANKIAIYTHKNPDGDAIGSAFALKLALLSYGKLAEVYLENSDDVKLFQFTAGIEFCLNSDGERLSENDCDLRISVDCADKHRLGVKLKNFTGNTMAIDHHVTHENFADFTLLDGDSASCGEIIYRLIRAMQVDITSDIANNLYMAIVADTGGFKYPAVTPETHRIAADLIECGANFTEISQSILDTYSMEYLYLTKIAIDKIKLYCNGKIAVLTLDNADFAAAEITDQLADKIVNLPRNIEGVEVSVYIRERESSEYEVGEYKTSLRSNGKVNVSAIAQKFGGGGHIFAAGFESSKDAETIVAEVIAELRGEFS